MKFFVYVDWTQEAVPRPFYVGKGDIRRVRLLRRNRLHQNISSKYGCERKIVLETEDEIVAFRVECELIARYQTYVHEPGSWGANFTRGGEGARGSCVSVETREKISLARKGKFKHSESSRLKMSHQRRGRKISESHRSNIQRASTGRFHTEETKRRLSDLARLQHQRRREQE